MATTSEGDDYDALLIRAGQILGRTWGGEIAFGTPERLTDPGRRNLLLRCPVRAAPPATPQTVVLKRAHLGEYRPDDATSWPAQGLFRDWAGLQFLGEVGGGRTGAPRFYGADREAGFILMEDLGVGEDLASRLLHGTAQQAEEGLLLLARTLGRMHTTTAGRQDAYHRVRGALSAWEDPLSRRSGDRVRENGQTVQEQCAALGVPVATTFPSDVETIARAIAEPGPFLAYTHGDPCPDNTLVNEAGLRLFDFEFGGYRHALLDGVYGRIRFPTCWCVGDLPEPVVDRMEAVYQEEWASAYPAVVEDAAYGRALTEACGCWLLDNLRGDLPAALESDRTWGIATIRQRLLKRLAVLSELSKRHRHLKSLGEVAERLWDQLEARWKPDLADLPLYPAFRPA